VIAAWALELVLLWHVILEVMQLLLAWLVEQGKSWVLLFCAVGLCGGGVTASQRFVL
jgi:hypothetical protein